VAVILADERGDRRGDLRLRHGGYLGALAERRGVRAENGDPDILGSFLLDAVLLPLRETAPTAVIGGDDERRVAALLRHRLHGVPKLADEPIHAVRALEHEIVAALVRPIVGLAVADEKDAGMSLLDVVQ
jgi:hypothetical protein